MITTVHWGKASCNSNSNRRNNQNNNNSNHNSKHCNSNRNNSKHYDSSNNSYSTRVKVERRIKSPDMYDVKHNNTSHETKLSFFNSTV